MIHRWNDENVVNFVVGDRWTVGQFANDEEKWNWPFLGWATVVISDNAYLAPEPGSSAPTTSRICPVFLDLNTGRTVVLHGTGDQQDLHDSWLGLIDSGYNVMSFKNPKDRW